jgi:hypothetical protein
VTDWGSTVFLSVFAGETLWPTGVEVKSGSLKFKRKAVTRGVIMKKQYLLVVVVALILLLSVTVGAGNVAAQGPAGAGASAAAKDTSSHSGHSLNPIKWVKKDSKTSTDSRSEIEKKLTPKFQAKGLLAANANATDACAAFVALDECLSSLHASHNLGIDFNCVRADVTGVHTNVDLSGCKGPVGEKAQNLTKSIHLLKPDADAKGQAKNAEKQAKDDLKEAGL